MRLLIDTNIVLDWLLKRNEDSAAVMRSCFTHKYEGCLSFHTLPDLFYILRREFDFSIRKEIVHTLCEHFMIIAEDRSAILEALQFERMRDFEDALQVVAAVNGEVDMIITRNKSDFIQATVPVMTSEEYRGKFE